jgi:hypothetical protein
MPTKPRPADNGVAPRAWTDLYTAKHPGLVVTSGPKVTLINTFYINELFDTFCYKQLKSMNILLLLT